MSKHEDIREGIWRVLRNSGLHIAEADDVLDAIWNTLHSQGVVIKVDRELPVVCELESDVDAYFGQEVCCEILPKYIKGAGSVSSECYREIIGLAYELADNIAKKQRDFNARAGYVAVEALIKEGE